MLLTKRHFLVALKDASIKYPELNIGHSYMSLLKYEKKGILKLPENTFSQNEDRNWRLYTQKEIEENVKRIIDYKLKSK